jgi:hypothetical protein
MPSCPEIMQIVNVWSVWLRETQRINLALPVQGILASRSGCLSTIVRSWKVGSSRHIHRLTRYHRFLKNPAVTVEPVFRAAASAVWSQRPAGQRARRVPTAIDWSECAT